jgi:titin
VIGNIVGLDAAGTARLPNSSVGVRIASGASSNRVGTNADGANDSAERNVISGNGSVGIAITNTNTVDNVVAGNYVGTNLAGNGLIGNTISYLVEGRRDGCRHG